MSNNKLSERLAILESMGFDTSKYNVVINDNKVEITGVAKQYVEDKQIQHEAFRRWITAQTFKMLNYASFNYENYEEGWDAYLRRNYHYKYQFTMMLEEFKTLNKLSITDKEEYEVRSRFFNKKVAAATCKHYLDKLFQYAKLHKDNKGNVKLAKYGVVQFNELNQHKDVVEMRKLINEIKNADNYAELYTLLKMFMSHMNKLPYDTPKCSLWKDAFKGNGAYYSLKNCILFNGMVLENCADKQSSIVYLEKYVSLLNNGEYWRLHQLLKHTITVTGFDLAESIRRNK